MGSGFRKGAKEDLREKRGSEICLKIMGSHSLIYSGSTFRSDGNLRDPFLGTCSGSAALILKAENGLFSSKRRVPFFFTSVSTAVVKLKRQKVYLCNERLFLWGSLPSPR